MPVLATGDVGVTPEQKCPAGVFPCADWVALIEALPPTLTSVDAPGGCSPPAQRPHCGSIHLIRVTFATIFLTAIGLVALGTKPTAVTILMFGCAPSATFTLKLPAPTDTSCEPSYGATIAMV